MKGKKNDFSISFYFKSQRVLFLQYVHDTLKAENWVRSKGIEWTHYVVYNRRTRQELQRVYNNYYTLYAMLFYYRGQMVYKLRNVWEYHDGFQYVNGLGIRFDRVDIYRFFDRSFVERFYF